MVRIRLRRIGLKGQPSYRIVVTDKRSPRDGRFIEIIGHHNPRTEPATDIVDEARALYWLGVGAQPSEAVQHILNRTGTQGRFERLKAGEELAALLAEAAENISEISPQTRFPAPGPGESKKKAREREALAAAEAN
jgi:small subunit ribosomal protein S16